MDYDKAETKRLKKVKEDAERKKEHYPDLHPEKQKIEEMIKKINEKIGGKNRRK